MFEKEEYGGCSWEVNIAFLISILPLLLWLVIEV